MSRRRKSKKTMLEQSSDSIFDLEGRYPESPGAILRRDLSSAVQVNIQEVADYYFARYKPHLRDNGSGTLPLFDVLETFPVLAPPWPNFFMSYRLPPDVDQLPFEESAIRGRFRKGYQSLPLGKIFREVGIHFVGEEVMNPTDEHRWTLYPMGYVTWGANYMGQRSPITLPVMAIPMIHLDSEGGIVMPDNPCIRTTSITGTDPDTEDWRDTYMTDIRISIPLLFGPAFMAITFIHASRDTKLQEGLPSERRRGQRKSKPSNERDWARRYTLAIKGLRELTKYEQNDSASGPKKALHSVRGHFARYTEEAPLFGRYVGLVWKPPHLRGLAQAGIIKKDYEVEVGEAELEPQ